MDIAQLLEAQANKSPNRPAFIFKDELFTFNRLKDLSFSLTDSLHKLGLKKGDKVAIYLPNGSEYIFTYLAIWCCGATAVPLDFMLTEEELISCICHSEATLLITKPKANLSLTALKDKCPTLKEIIACQERLEGFLSFEDLLGKEIKKLSGTQINDQDCAIIFYTSGTTGKPKGVLVNYRQLGGSPQAMKYFVDLGEKDIALCALPFSHLGGLVFLQAIVFLGTTVVLMERFIPLEFLKNISDYKATCFWLVPSMYYAFLQLKEFEDFNLSSLNWICIFGAPGSMDQLRRFHQYCSQADIFHGWGMTETQGPSIVTPRGCKKLESVGRPAPWIEVKIFDDEDKELPQEEIGEIVVKSWIVSDGYYKDPGLTSQTLRNGWFHTGDLGRLDEEGDLYIAGRKKEMIKVAGEIVFEPEVEAAIHKHPDVAEVAVIGVADKLRGEVPKAFVVLKEGARLSAEDLRYFCRQHLAHFKIPHYFEFTSALPKNRAGKIDKEELRTKKTASVDEKIY
jgi:acyl-CoA synthetase (AMP-forming)/AMP-acid ligase II